MTTLADPIYFLLVDDLEENLLALEALLQREGLTCLKARSGEEALELLLVHDVALALLDVQMPGMDGFQLAEFMRGNARSGHIPIIFVTAGSADLQRRFRGYEAGAVDFIQKPVEPDILRSKAEVFFDLHHQRRQIVAQRDALEVHADALRIINRHKNEFLAMLGHELRNPLMALRSGLELLNRPDKASSHEDIRHRMERQLFHLARLVEDLLDISRIEQGKISLQRAHIAIQTIVDSAIETSRPQIDAMHHALTVDIPPEPLWVDVDYTRMSQVVSNLLNNAAKYTPAGGQIRLVVQRADGYVVVEVADNGIGVPDDMKDGIFDLFTQAGRPGSPAPEGLGIGLALVRQLVDLHGGTIALTSSAPDVGSTFTVRLPMLP